MQDDGIAGAGGWGVLLTREGLGDACFISCEDFYVCRLSIGRWIRVGGGDWGNAANGESFRGIGT